jgi:hypothetical protein
MKKSMDEWENAKIYQDQKGKSLRPRNIWIKTYNNKIQINRCNVFVIYTF